MADEFPLWVVSFESEGFTVRVVVNDVTLYDKRTGAQTSFAEKINPVLQAGKNSIQVLLGIPSKSHSQPSDEPVPSEFALRLQRGTHGKDPGIKGVLARFDWKLGQPPATPGPLISVFEESFQIAVLPWEPPPWIRAAQVPVDPLAMEDLVWKYAEMLRAGDVEGLAVLNAVKFRHVAMSMDLEIAEVNQGFRGQMEYLMSSADWEVTVAPRLASLPEGHAQLVRITGADGVAPLSAVSQGRRVPFEVTVSFIDGSWRIVR